MSAEIRVGKVSSIDYPGGMIRVVYHDKDDDVTRPIPLLSSEYAMPPVGAMVAVLHLSNGPEAGMVLGRPWSTKHLPPEGFEGLYRKDFAPEPGRCYFRYDPNGPESLYHTEGNARAEIGGSQETQIKGDQTTTIQGDAELTVSGKLTLKVGSCTVEIDGSSVSVIAASEVSLSAPALKLEGTTVQISGGTVNISGGGGDCVLSGKSLTTHTHTGNLGAPTTPPL